MKFPLWTKSKSVSKILWSKILGLNEKLHFSFSTIPINQNASFQSKLNVVLCHYSSINTVHHFWFGWNFALLVYPLTQYVNFGLNYCLLWNNFARAQCSKSLSRISTFFIGFWRNCSNRHINLTWPLLSFEIHILCRHCPYAFSSVRDLCHCTSHHTQFYSFYNYWKRP